MTDVHTTSPFVFFVVLPGNAIGDEGATALAGALGQLKDLSYCDLESASVLWWYVIGSGMQVSPTLSVVGVWV